MTNSIIKFLIWGRQYYGLQKLDETGYFHDLTFSISFICRMRFVLVQAQQTKTELVTLRKFSYFLQHYFNHYICLYLLVFSEECSSLGGTSDGSCASGFGVCCVCKYIYLTLHCIKPSLTFFHYDFLVNTVGLYCPKF